MSIKSRRESREDITSMFGSRVQRIRYQSLSQTLTLFLSHLSLHLSLTLSSELCGDWTTGASTKKKKKGKRWGGNKDEKLTFGGLGLKLWSGRTREHFGASMKGLNKRNQI
jgi:hypothetical protein